MYKKPTVGWFKHFDFIVLDMLCLQLAFVLSYMISGNGANPYSSLLYGTMAVLLECIDLVVLTGFDVLKNVLKRGYYTEFIATLRHTLVVAAVAICVLFVLRIFPPFLWPDARDLLCLRLCGAGALEATTEKASAQP